MLALTRRINEEVVIGDPDHPLGVIRVVSVHGDKVRLSFDFPRDVKINRRELADQKKNGGDTAANPPAKPQAKRNGNGQDTDGKNNVNHGVNGGDRANSPATDNAQDNATATNDNDANQGAA